MNNTAIRIYMVVAIIVVTAGVSRLLKIATDPPEVEMPAWTFDAMPLQLGNWHGEATKMDPKIAAATGADVIVDRAYRNETGQVVSLHTAMFKDPAEGILHNPFNCYRGNGWERIDGAYEDVAVSDDMTISVSLTTWEKEGQQVFVVYWYQLGELVLYSRADLGAARWAMRGEPKWPVLIKVMLQIGATDQQDSKTALLDVVKRTATWLNRPDHRQYLGRWRNI